MSVMQWAKLYRLNLGLSQQELAQESCVSLATIQNIEAEKANPSLTTLESLFSTLGYSIHLSPKSLDWDFLAAHGFPIMSKNQLSLHPTKKNLIVLLYSLSTNILQIESRYKKALIAFLFAIKDHYPSTWKSVPLPLKKFIASKKTNIPSIKLRRITLTLLSEFL